jgi:hypothetical protein
VSANKARMRPRNRATSSANRSKSGKRSDMAP